MTKPLSPAAQAVLDAVKEICPAPADELATAALRAAVDQLKHGFPLSPEYTEWDSGHDAGIQRAGNKILAIAAELDDLSYSTGKDL